MIMLLVNEAQEKVVKNVSLVQHWRLEKNVDQPPDRLEGHFLLIILRLWTSSAKRNEI